MIGIPHGMRTLIAEGGPAAGPVLGHGAGVSCGSACNFDVASEQGAERWAVLATLIESCRLHGVNPHTYLTDVLTLSRQRPPGEPPRRASRRGRGKSQTLDGSSSSSPPKSEGAPPKINAVNGVRTRHGGACAFSAGLVTGRWQAGSCCVRRRPADLGRRGSGAGGDQASSSASPSAWRAASRIPRDPQRVSHSLAEMIRFRALLVAAGYPGGNDCDSLRGDPAFKMAVGRLSESGRICARSRRCAGSGNLPPRHRAQADDEGIYCGHP